MEIVLWVILAGLLVSLLVGIGFAVVSFFGRVLIFPLVEYERVAVFKKTGEFVGIQGPGRIRIWPSIWFILSGEQVRGQYGQVVTKENLEDPISKFDLRERAENMHEEHCITADSAVVGVTPAVVYQITDPAKLVLNVQNHLTALGNSVTAILRSVVGGMLLTDVIAGRESIAEQVSRRLSEQADRWGINVISVEIQDVKPDPAVEQAMNERRAAEERAERDRQDLVVAAEARRQGAKADNEVTIARAEADKQAAIMKAEGEKEAELLKAEGISALYKVLMDLGSGADIALRYEQIQALRNLGDSSNSKLVIVPASMGMVGNLAELPLIEGAMPSPPPNSEVTA